jgi:hypothetical protein
LVGVIPRTTGNLKLDVRSNLILDIGTDLHRCPPLKKNYKNADIAEI